ncbi:iron ABC transporter permease [Pseudomonas sp. F1_0610]|uniref:FecCD family ABC transporter permease n=1 Tax=Pseudomonas sp. F1_0610 TaxID=3114284 RepID=UPI0039C2DCC8
MRTYLIYGCLCAILLGLFIVATLAGKYPLSLNDISQALLSPTADSANQLVLWQVRFPRIFAALLVGASLAVAGAAYQGMFRNPLVSPDILGVSTGAGLGAVLAIYANLPLFYVQLFALFGGLAAVTLVYSLAQLIRRHDAVLVLVLSGVALSSLFGAGISLVKVLADTDRQLPTITFWLLGSLNSVRLADLLYSLPLIIGGLVVLFVLRWRMNLLALGDDEAAALGVNLKLTRILLIIAATMVTASAISFTGIIGWVGLLIPHAARLLVGAHFSRLLPASLLLGAIFLLLTDTIARTCFAVEMPLGVLTSLVGAPFFMLLLACGGRKA